MNNERILSALSYSSALYLPIIVPLVVYFAQDGEFAKYHAKRAVVGQFIFLAAGIVSMILMLFTTLMSSNSDVAGIALVVTFAIFTLISVAIALWSIIMTIRVVR